MVTATYPLKTCQTALKLLSVSLYLSLSRLLQKQSNKKTKLFRRVHAQHTHRHTEALYNTYITSKSYLVVLGEMYRFFWGSLLLPLLLLLFLFTRSQSNARRGRQPKGLYKSGPETNRKRSLFYQSPPFLKRVVRFWGPCFLTPSFKQRSFLPPALFFGWLCALGF
jgi:hypothetical protein